ncbi:MAG: DUF3630 family protein [Aestuariibacter sp.]
MQQLSGIVQIQTNDHSVVLSGHGFADTSDVAGWLQLLVQQQLLSIVEFNMGADRAQWLVNYADQIIILFFEELSESLWFEALQRNDARLLQTLSKQLEAIV